MEATSKLLNFPSEELLQNNHLLSPFELRIFCSGSVGEFKSKDHPITSVNGRRESLTVATLNPEIVRRVRTDEEYEEAEKDPYFVWAERHNRFLQGGIACFTGLLELHKEGLAIRVYLAPLVDKGGETTDEWKVQIVRVKDENGPILPGKQKPITGDKLEKLKLRDEAAQEMVIEREEGKEDFVWLRLREIQQ